MRQSSLVIILAACITPAAPQPSSDPIEAAFSRLYNFDFLEAHKLLDAYIAAHPDDPMGYSVRSSVYLFDELNRLGILESEFFANDKRIIEKKKLKPDPLIRMRFLDAIETAQTKALAVLANKPEDYNSLYALCVIHGVIVDYTALIEKKHIGSLSLAKRSNGCAQRLLKAHPDAYDAYVTTGFTEYLVGSLPFYVRWLVRFDEVRGSKEIGIEKLQIAARSGRYLKPFAKILLSVVWLREKKPQQAEKLLAELTHDYPENPLLRKELGKVSAGQR